MQATLTQKVQVCKTVRTAWRSTARRTPMRIVAATAPAKQAGSQNEENTVEAKRALARSTMQWFRVPPKIYFKGGCLEVALSDLVGRKRAFIVTDKTMLDMDFPEKVTRILDTYNIHHQVFYHVDEQCTLSSVMAGMREINDFKPDVIIALGGGSPMDAAKAMWIMYEQPNNKFEQLVGLSAAARKRVNDSEVLGTRALMVCVPTTSGTGAEVTPFAVVKDDKTGKKHTIVDYSLTPSMAVLDPQLVIGLPASQTAYGGMATIAHAIESYISVFASDYTRGLSKQTLTMVTRYYARAYKNGSNDYHAREKMHNAATVAGMATANTFLGVCHGLASELAAAYHMPMGLAYGLCIGPVLRFMLKDPATTEAVAHLADWLHLGGFNPADKCDHVLAWVESMKKAADIPTSIKAVVGESRQAEFVAHLPKLAQAALEDANTFASPVQPNVNDLVALLTDAWNGKKF